MTAIDVILCEDGHAQERSLLDEVVRTVAAKDLWIADRNFCTTGFLFGIAGRGGFFVIRQHASTLHYALVGKRKARGRVETGAVYEQTLRAIGDAGEVLLLRRVTVVLDKPTRDGDREIHLLTNLPAKVAPARVIAELYRRRLDHRDGLRGIGGDARGGDRHAGLSQGGAVRLLRGLGVVQRDEHGQGGAARSHGAAVIDEKFSGYYLADEVRMNYRGMMRAIPKEEWVEYQEMPAEELAAALVGWARTVPLSEYRKSPRGPKKPRPEKESGAKIKHMATAKVLKARQESTELQV